GGHQNLAIRTEGKAVRMRGNLNLYAKWSNQAAIGKNCLSGKINLDRTLNRGRSEFQTSLPTGLTRQERHVPPDKQNKKDPWQERPPRLSVHDKVLPQSKN